MVSPRPRRWTLLKNTVLTSAVAAATLVGCAGPSATDTAAEVPADTRIATAQELSSSTITVYSGRNEEYLGPVIDAFETATGATVEARYGDSAEMAMLINVEGDRTPADVFVSQSPGAVGFLAQNGRLGTVNPATAALLGDSYSAADNSWVGFTGRVRVLVYNTDKVDPDELPASVFDLTDPKYKGRVAVAPANGSFQDFVTAMRARAGEETAAQWLADMAANEAPNYAKNSAIVDAVARGEVDMGLVNHYYLEEAKEENPNIAAANHLFESGDVGSLLIISAAAVVKSSKNQPAAQAFVEYLLGQEAQGLSASAEKEYPLIADVPLPEGLLPLDQAAAERIDFATLAGGLEATTAMIQASGIVQ